MKPAWPDHLAERARQWDILTRWERAELGRAVRRLGWSYGEIMEVIPVPKGTLAYWCREIVLTEEQIEAIKSRTGSRRGLPRDTQRWRHEEVEWIRAQARAQVPNLIKDPVWLAGTMLYWGEGAKTKTMLALTNTDDRILRLFIRWVQSYHDPHAAFVLSLHLHHGNDEAAAKEHWAGALRLEDPEFYKTFIKPPGTGHRKNRYEHGVCRVLVRKSADAWHRSMAWIDELERAIDPAAGTR